MHKSIKLYRYLILNLIFCTIISLAHCQTAVNWTGSVSSDWGTAGSWSNNAVPATTDNVQIGFVAFNNQPIVSLNCQVNTVSFGSIQPIVFTVMQNAVVQVAGNIIQSHSTNNIMPKTILAGNGSIYCNALFVGNNILPKVIISKMTNVISTISNLYVATNLTLYAVSSDLLSGGKGNNNSSFSLQAGQLSIGGQIKTYQVMPPYLQSSASGLPYGKFSIDIVGNQNATLALGDSISVSLANAATDTVNFNNYISGTGSSTVNYNGAGQVIYTNSFSAINNKNHTYQNLVISGSGVKTIVSASGNTLLVGGAMHVISGSIAVQATSSVIKVQSYP